MRALPLALLFALSCSRPRDDIAPAPQPLTASPSSIFRVVAGRSWSLPNDVPDDLLDIPDPFHRKQTISLSRGTVIGAWTTAPTASGSPAAILWECKRKPTPNDLSADAGPIGSPVDADGDAGPPDEYTWHARTEAGLVPLGVDLSGVPNLLSYTATLRDVPPAGVYDFAPSGPAWTVDGTIGSGASRGDLVTTFIGESDQEADSPNDNAVPLVRYKKIAGSRSMPLSLATIDRAAYVLRLNTQGGVGPDEAGASCDAGTDPVRAEFTADFYFVVLPWPASDWPLVAGAE